MISAQETHSRILEGDHRPVIVVQDKSDLLVRGFRRELLAGQKHLAVVQGCPDSRVPLEISFDR